MLRFVTITTLFLIAAFAATIHTGYAQEEYSMEEMMALAQPGPEHKLLATFVGDWNIEMGINMEMKKGGTMSPSKGSGTARPILGGRFVQFDNTMTFMGQSSNSLQIMGFDRRFNKYTYYAIDEWGTYYITAEGTYNERNKTLTLTGTDTWPTKDGGTKTEQYEMVYTFPEDGAFTFKVKFVGSNGELYDMVDGKATRK